MATIIPPRVSIPRLATLSWSRNLCGQTLAALQQRFPKGMALRRYNRHGRLLFEIWAVGDAAQALSTNPP